MRKIIQQIMALTALCWVMTSCTDEAFNQEYGEGMGYLRLELGKVDVEVSSTTKADVGSLPEGLIPTTTDSFKIDIKQGNKSVDGYPKKYSELKEGIELKAGGYTVIAYYGDNEPIQDTPYFSGSSTVEIYPGKSTETNINVLYKEQVISVYTNKVDLQRKLNKVLGEPTKEYIIKRSISGSVWEIPFTNKTKIRNLMLKANIFEL